MVLSTMNHVLKPTVQIIAFQRNVIFFFMEKNNNYALTLVDWCLFAMPTQQMIRHYFQFAKHVTQIIS